MKRVLVIPDLHIPLDDKKAVKSIQAYASTKTWDELIFLGDLIDFDFIARFNVDYPRLTAGKQFDATYEEAGAALDKWLAVARKRNKDCKVVYIEGNHEYRVERYLDKHPELTGCVEVPIGMRLIERGVKWVPFWSIGTTYRIGKCTFLHGNWIDLHHAKKHVMAYMTSVVYGHVHDIQSFSLIKQSQRHPIEGTSLGCLCGPQPWMRGKPNNWQTAFGVFYFEENGFFQKYVVRVISGKFRSPEGESYG